MGDGAHHARRLPLHHRGRAVDVLGRALGLALHRAWGVPEEASLPLGPDHRCRDALLGVLPPLGGGAVVGPGQGLDPCAVLALHPRRARPRGGDARARREGAAAHEEALPGAGGQAAPAAHEVGARSQHDAVGVQHQRHAADDQRRLRGEHPGVHAHSHEGRGRRRGQPGSATGGGGVVGGRCGAGPPPALAGVFVGRRHER
mmetsp:Transcript_124214/g.347854  ORF Transcript_124214/g.347854 Transcript_124214/m.347854 type:complete len:202 (+) Transcript_124214:694-1299(+)